MHFEFPNHAPAFPTRGNELSRSAAVMCSQTAKGRHSRPPISLTLGQLHLCASLIAKKICMPNSKKKKGTSPIPTSSLLPWSRLVLASGRWKYLTFENIFLYALLYCSYFKMYDSIWDGSYDFLKLFYLRFILLTSPFCFLFEWTLLLNTQTAFGHLII